MYMSRSDRLPVLEIDPYGRDSARSLCIRVVDESYDIPAALGNALDVNGPSSASAEGFRSPGRREGSNHAEALHSDSHRRS